MNAVINKSVEIRNLGMVDYQETWDLQEKLFKKTVDQKIANRKLPEEAQTSTENVLLFCQHPHVYTLGKTGKEENLLVDASQLDKLEASYYRINRGGDITYHGPGQIVCYPILDLDNFFTDIHQYMRTLEEAVIRTCAEYGLTTTRIEGLTGVWIDDPIQPRKIAAMGVKSSRWVTMHGLSFNVNPDLSYFQHIVPCGIDDKAVTSLQQETNQKLDLEDVRTRLEGHLLSLFEME